MNGDHEDGVAGVFSQRTETAHRSFSREIFGLHRQGPYTSPKRSYAWYLFSFAARWGG